LRFNSPENCLFAAPCKRRPSRTGRASTKISAFPRVLLIDQHGEKQGVMPTSAAIEAAEEAGLDLVEIVPNADPPVCKILDYGKFKFQEQKKKNEARQASEGGGAQGNQAPAEHRRPRLRGEGSARCTASSKRATR
jgi:hypothetical protein